MAHPTGLLGIAVLVALAVLISEDRRRFPVRFVAVGVALQFALAWVLLKFPPVVLAFSVVGHGVNTVISSAEAGSYFLFGELSVQREPWGLVFATRVLPVIVFFASLMGVLYHLGVMQRVVAGLAWLLRRTMHVTGTEALVVAANVFVGQTEALALHPAVRPRMTRSQLATVMVGGFATIAGSVMAAYVSMLGGPGGEHAPERVYFIKHLLTASIISAPAAFVMSKIIVPETDKPIDEGLRSVGQARTTRNVLDAAAAGATDGLRLALNVAAMLVAFVSLLALVNIMLGALGRVGLLADATEALGVRELRLEVLMGWLLAPLAWVMGVPWGESPFFGSLMGQQVVATEFVAYSSLAADVHSTSPVLSERSAAMATYALCGFANFPSIAIQIGGLSAIAPDRRAEFASLGLRAMVAGAFACWMTACVAGVLVA